MKFRTIQDLPKLHADTNPDAAAIHCRGATITYEELDAQTTQLCSSLRAVGLEPGEKAAVFLPNCSDQVIAAFAIFKACGVFAPLNPLLRPRQVLHILQDSDASILITSDDKLNVLLDYSRLPESTRLVISTSDGPEFSHERLNKHYLRYSSLFASSPSECASRAKLISRNTPAVLFYTSGSTGAAKGVCVTHENIVDGAALVSSYLCNSHEDRILATLPMSFDYGFSQVTTSLYVGCTAYLANYSLPQMLFQQIDQHKITGLAGVPTMWNQIALHRGDSRLLRSIRYITNSGGRLPVPVIKSIRRQLPEASIYLMYGFTEAFRSTYLDPSLVDDHPTSIGNAVPGVEIHVVDSNGNLCEDGQPGQLVHSGKLISLGYPNDAASTQEKILPLVIRDGTGSRTIERAAWSGDIVKRDRNGLLYFVGRADNLIKSQGFRVSPAEIEDVIYETGLVDDVVAVGVENPNLGHEICVAAAPRSQCSSTGKTIRKTCARELPTFMQPKQFRLVESIPLLPNGKHDRQAVKRLFDD